MSGFPRGQYFRDFATSFALGLGFWNAGALVFILWGAFAP